MNEQAWQNLEDDKKHRMPTPPVGWPVQWFPNGDKRRPTAARVIVVEQPGRVRLEVKAPNSFPKEQAGVYHVNAKIHLKLNNQTTYNCGSWDYLPGMDIPKVHWEAFDADIERREEWLLKSEDTGARLASEFQATKAKKAAEAKTRLPEPLPAPAE